MPIILGPGARSYKIGLRLVWAVGHTVLNKEKKRAKIIAWLFPPDEISIPQISEWTVSFLFKVGPNNNPLIYPHEVPLLCSPYLI